MFNKFLNKLANFDLFGGTVTLRANNSETIKTLPGFLITLIVSVLGLAAFISLIMEMYAKENPEVYEHVQQMVSTNNTFTFDPYELTTITYVGDSNYNPISNTPEKTYFTIQYRFCEGNLNCWFVEAQSCPDLIINYLSDRFGFSSQLSRLGYCLDEQYWSTNKITLSGTYITENFTRVEIIVEKCQNSTTNAYICATPDEINLKLTDSYIIYGIQDYQFDRNNFDHPFQKSFQYFTQQIHFDFPQTAYLRYAVAEVTTETNFFFLWPTTSTNNAVEFEDAFVDAGRPNQTQLGKAIFMLTTRRVMKYRVYKNIINVFGTIGGLINLMMAAAKVVILPFNWVALRLYVLTINNTITKTRSQCQESEKVQNEYISLWGMIKSKRFKKDFIEKSNSCLQLLDVQTILTVILNYQYTLNTNHRKSDEIQAVNSNHIMLNSIPQSQLGQILANSNQPNHQSVQNQAGYPPKVFQSLYSAIPSEPQIQGVQSQSNFDLVE